MKTTKQKIEQIAVMSSVDWVKAAAVEKVLCNLVMGELEITRNGWERKFYLDGVVIFHFAAKDVAPLNLDNTMKKITNYFSNISTDNIILLSENPRAFTASRCLPERTIRININIS